MHVRPLALAALVTSLPAFAAGSLSQYPKKAGAPIRGAAVTAELAGEAAVVVAAGNRVLAFGLDGKPLKGFPISLGEGEEAVGDLAAADMDGDGRAEVAIATKSGKLYVLSKGVVAPGFPVALAAGCAAGPSFADLDGDGRPEVIQGDSSGQLHVLKANGHELPPFPVTLGEPLTSSPSIGRLHGELAVAIGAEKGSVYVVDVQGRPLDGFPLVTHFTVSGAPAFGDVDDDGQVDLVVASRDFNLYAVDGAGKLLPGFPVSTELACSGSPALADLDGDDVLDIAFASTDGKLYAVSGTGKLLPGFPVKLGTGIATGVAVGDLDRDGRPDLLVAATNGAVSAVSAGGKALNGSPLKVGQEPATPYLARLKDGAVVAFIGAADGTLAGLRFDLKASGPPGSIAWAGSAHDAARTSRFHPNPLRYKNLVLSPKPVRIDDALKASWTFFSVDGQAEPPPALSWVRNGQRVKELDGKKEVPARTAKKGERWRFDVQVGQRVVRGPELTVQDTPPSAPRVRVQPAELSVKGNGKVEVVTPSQDADGDKVSYRISWLVDGQHTDLTGELLPAKRLKKGQRWTAVVIPFDGQLEGPPSFAEARVVNTPPGAPKLAMEPRAPKKGQLLSPVLQAPGPDPDGDPVQHRYRWAVNGVPLNDPLGQATLSSDPLKKGDRVSLEVTAYDGKAEGDPWKGEVQLVNTPPLAPKVALLPAEPRAGQALRALVKVPAVDADADPLTYRPAWTRNGKPYAPAGDAFEVPVPDVKKGDRWTVALTPNDGEVDGPAGTAETTVRNTPPTAPKASLKPEHPSAAGGVEVVIDRASEDADGEPVKYTFAWTRDGKPVGAGPQDKARKALSTKEFKKHERIRVVVTPSDGAAEGTAGVAEAVVENVPPGAPGVALEPATPTNQGALKAVIRTAATDADGDALQYRYAWRKNGTPQDFPEAQAELPASALKKGDHWTVRVRAWDGEVEGPPATASAEVGNAAPPAPKVALAPAAPRRGQELRAVLTEAVDPDGDPLSYRFAWKRDGTPVALPPQAGAVPREQPKKGETWAVDVIANDGAADSRPAHAEVKIANTPPGLPGVGLCDGPVPAGAALEVKVLTPSVDADGDAVKYRYEWTVNGQPATKWSGRTKLGAGDTKKHDRLRVTVIPNDGTEDGASAVAECEVEDTPPAAPVAVFDPVEPSAGSGLKVRVPQPPADRDGDAVSYRYAWTKNGLPFDVGADGSAVKPGALARGDELRVTVTSFDGEREGGQAALTVRVKNTAPPLPAVDVTPVQAVTGEKLTCAAKVPATDADGDPVRVHLRWLRNGAVTPLAEDQAELPTGTVKKGEKWRCEAWSDDGFALSGKAGAEATVKNSPPGTPKVVIEPEKPATGAELLCRVAGEAGDPDGDPVKYRYQWTRNGKPEASAEPPSRIPGDRTRKGDTWRCTITASDGALDGPLASAERTVENSPPGAPRISLGPPEPKAGQPLTCEILDAALDPDGDKVEHRFYWFKDGVEQSFAPVSQEVPGRLVKSRELWTCEVQASDGELQGPRASSQAILVP